MNDTEKLTESEKTELLRKLKNNLQASEARVSELEELLHIYRLWVKHREKMFPENCRGMSIRGVDLDILRQNFFGCVSTFLTRGGLTNEQKEYLYACDDDLGIVTLELQGYEGFYFRQMKTLISAVIVFLKSHAA
jgi:hypothetical protein